MALKRCACGCGTDFETDNPRKIFINKQHSDRSRNHVYSQAPPVTWRDINDLRHFSKLDNEGKRNVLLGRSTFSVCSFDIEATNLKANIGRIICCSFKPLGLEPYTFHALEKGFMKKDVYDDSALATAIRSELEKYNIIVGWNSKEFDVKFINARCLRGGERTKRPQHHVDGMWSWRNKFAAWSGLDNVQKFVDPEGDTKSPIRWSEWMRVLGWDRALRESAMAEIVEHCEKDVIVLENVYRKVVAANVVRSLKVDGGIL